MASLKSNQRQIDRIEGILNRGGKEVPKIGPSTVVGSLAQGFRIIRTTERRPLSKGQREMLQLKLMGLRNQEKYLWESMRIVPILNDQGFPIGSKKELVRGTYSYQLHGELK